MLKTQKAGDAKRILLTGGHGATTGLAVVEEIRKTEKLLNSEIYWIGSQTAIEGSKISTMESRIFPKINVKFIPIIAGKIQTKFTIHTVPSIIKIPIGFIQALYFLLKIRPDVVLSFGGYSSLPVVFWSYILRVPVILHEQTVAAGRASIASSFFATKIALARAESQKYFPKNKAVITGNPLMSNILDVKPKEVPGSPATIFVIGGSRGSNFINKLIISIAKEILPHFILIHVTGERDFEKVEEFRERLPAVLKGNYKTYLSIEPTEIGTYYSKADLIIGRAGANSVSEIIYTKRPAILIPLPRTFMGEQVKNARYAEGFGIASVYLEKEVKSDLIIKEINRLFKEWQKIVANVSKIANPDKDASKRITRLLEEYI